MTSAVTKRACLRAIAPPPVVRIILHEGPGKIDCLIPGMWLASRTNRRGRWIKLHKETRGHRKTVVDILSRPASRASWREAAMVRAHLTYEGPRRMDPDNLAAALKNVQDGVAEAFGVDDGDDSFWWWIRDQRKVAGDLPAVRIVLTRIDPLAIDWKDAAGGKRAVLSVHADGCEAQIEIQTDGVKSTIKVVASPTGMVEGSNAPGAIMRVRDALELTARRIDAGLRRRPG